MWMTVPSWWAVGEPKYIEDKEIDTLTFSSATRNRECSSCSLASSSTVDEDGIPIRISVKTSNTLQATYDLS